MHSSAVNLCMEFLVLINPERIQMPVYLRLEYFLIAVLLISIAHALQIDLC